jgi:hypothetical protein
MRAKYAAAQQHNYPPAGTIFDPTVYNVAVHVRTGDIQLHSGDAGFFSAQINSTVNAHLSHLPVHIYWIGQFPKRDGSRVEPGSEWSFLDNLHSNTSFFRPDERTALHHSLHGTSAGLASYTRSSKISYSDM